MRKPKHRIDLGGTSSYNHKGDVICSLDGTGMADCPMVKGNYNFAPFPDNTFYEAWGTCALEERFDWIEIRRILKDGAYLHVSSCGTLPRFPQMLVEAADAGFELISRPGWVTESEDMPGEPIWVYSSLDYHITFRLHKETV